MKKVVKRLPTIAGALIRELERKLPQEVLSHYEKDFELYSKVITQKKNDKEKINYPIANYSMKLSFRQEMKSIKMGAKRIKD